jgi:alpha-galactosidase
MDERYAWRAEAQQEIEHLMADAAALDGWLAAPSGEAADAIITALAAGGRYEGIMNLPNRGQAPNLPPEVVVETLGVIEGGVAAGLPTGDVPPAIEAILLRHIANQELTVEAALAGSHALALQALLGDALCPSDLHAAERMLGEMFEANRRYLPQFF